MSMTQWLLTGSAVVVVGVLAAAPGAAKPVFRKPPPPGVLEITGIGAGGGIVELQDGAWMLAVGNTSRISRDEGQTWEEAQPLACPFPVSGMIRLQSGALAVYGRSGDYIQFSSSPDEGQTWTEPAPIVPVGALYGHEGFTTLFRSMIQLGDGRLLLVGQWQGLDSWVWDGRTLVGVHPELQYMDASSWGGWRGHRIQIEGHGHAPEMGMTMIYHSDDEGATWQKHVGGLMGWFDAEGVVNGNGGLTPFFEPTIAETQQGDVLVIGRSTVGRLVQSVSRDQGEMWAAVTPTDLPSSQSPAQLITLPQTGDLLMAWNQVSREEIRRGYRRGRLSAALSRDGGHSWENFKTLELSEGLEDMDRVPPEYPIRNVVARDWVGRLPDGFAMFHYANLDVLGDKVVLRYSRGWREEVEGDAVGMGELEFQPRAGGEAVLRVYPVEWFYE